MVNPSVRPLLALALATLEWAKTLFVFRLLAHALTLVFALAGAYALTQHDPDQKHLFEAIELGGAALAILSEFAALWFHHRALEHHLLGRQMMRRVMLADGAGLGDPAAARAEFEAQVGAAVRRRAARYVQADAAAEPDKAYLTNYYYSTREFSPARLRDHLLESATFSAELYSAAWKFSLVVIVAFVVGAVGVLYLATGGPSDLVLRVVIILVSFLPLSQELDHLLIYRMSAHRLHRLTERLEADYTTSPVLGSALDAGILTDYADYGASTTLTPPIRTLVYLFWNEKLTQIFAAKMRALAAGPPSSPAVAPAPAAAPPAAAAAPPPAPGDKP